MKLVIVLDEALSEGMVLTHKKFLDSFEINADGKPAYQGTQLNRYKQTKKRTNFAWPIKEDCGTFGNSEIVELRNHFQTLLKNNECDIKKIDSEWLTLKTHMIPAVQNQDHRKSNYLEIWQKIFCNESIKQECKNVLHVFEIMLIVPFTNAKVEHLFSRMNRVKTDICNRLSH